MAATGSHLRIKPIGGSALGVRLEGDRGKPEPDHFQVAFPGGDVNIMRTSGGQYWVHIHVDHEKDGLFNGTEDAVPHRIIEARLDRHGKHSGEANLGDFEDDDLFNVAFLIAPKQEGN